MNASTVFTEPRGQRDPSRSGGSKSPRRASSRSRLAITVGVQCLLVVLLWSWSLPRVDVDRIGDIGLVSVLPPTFFLAFLLLTTSFAMSLRGRLGDTWTVGHIVLLVLLLHGTIPLLYEQPRFAYLYKHLGVVDLVDRFGTVDRTIDVYNNWPSFFLSNALFREAAGLSGSLGYAPWAPVFFNLVSALLLEAAFRPLVRDRAIRQLGIWIFLCGNWVGQDYLAPQAFGFALTLAIVAVVLTWLPRGAPVAVSLVRRILQRERDVDSESPSASKLSRQNWLALALVGTLFTAVVASHQLTPLVATALTAGLVLVAGTRPWWLPLVMLAVTAAWFWFVAGDFILTNMALVGDVGQRPDSAVKDELSDLTTAPGQVIVAKVSRALSGSIWLLAMAGLVLRWRAGHRDRELVVLSLVPLPLLGLVTYGGEMLFRVYLFTLPWVSLFAAVAVGVVLLGGASRGARWRVVVSAGTLFALLLGLLVSGFGQEKANYITTDEVQASAWFYENAPDGSLMMLLNGNFPSRLEGNYGRFEVRSLFTEEPRYENYRFGQADLSRLIRILSDDTRASLVERRLRRANAYVVVSSGQTAYADLYRQSTPAQMRSFEALIRSSPEFDLVYSALDARIYRLQQVIRR